MASAMRKIKGGLFNLSKKEPEIDSAPQPQKIKEQHITYNDYGFEQAKNHSGGATALKIELHKIYNGYKEELRQDEIEQAKLKRPYKVKLEGLKTDNEELKKKNQEIEEKEKPKIKERTEELKKEIRFIKENPESITGDNITKVSFYIGLIIIAFLTLYLLVFYSSASYSAFFKQFTQTNIGVVKSIFDPQAFTKALSAGTTELILISAMPFVFLGLGYLIHKFQEQEGNGKYFKIPILLLVTFVFDCILAFEITQKIYKIEMANSFQDMPEYTLSSAFANIEFWMIIFAGFVVYIIWGFVFDFVMDSYSKLDKVGMSIKSKREEINNLINRSEILDKTIYANKETISSNTTQIQKLNEILNSYVIQPKKFEKIYSEFLTGWVHCLNALKLGEEKVLEAKEIGERFIENVINDFSIEKYSYEAYE